MKEVMRGCYVCGGEVDHYGRCADCNMGWPGSGYNSMKNITWTATKEPFDGLFKKKDQPDVTPTGPQVDAPSTNN